MFKFLTLCLQKVFFSKMSVWDLKYFKTAGTHQVKEKSKIMCAGEFFCGIGLGIYNTLKYAIAEIWNSAVVFHNVC